MTEPGSSKKAANYLSLRMPHKIISAFILLLTFCICISCGEDEISTTFSGTATRESDGKGASGVKIVITGIDVENSILWPASKEVTRNTVVVDAQGKFTISIPENSSVDKYAMQAEHPSTGGGTISIISGCEWPCSGFKPGSMNTFVLKVQL